MNNRTEQFATACAEYLEKQEGANFEATKQNAIDNTDELWNYLWCLNSEDARNICIEYKDVTSSVEEIANNARYYMEKLIDALSRDPKYTQQQMSYEAITNAASWLDVGLSEYNM